MRYFRNWPALLFEKDSCSYLTEAEGTGRPERTVKEFLKKFKTASYIITKEAAWIRVDGISGSFIKLKSLYEKNTNHCNVAARGCIDSLCAASGDRQGDGPERGATDRSGSHGKRQPHADRNDHGQRRPVQSVCITGRSPSVLITRIPDRRSSRER